MITAISYILAGVYLFAVFYVTLYCWTQLHLLLAYHKKKEISTYPPLIEEELPYITVQLPIFNELYVVERLIDSVMALDYPPEKLEIEILDDSTDETVQLVEQKVKFYSQNGLSIKHLRRKERTGYKAGALKAATPQARGEFIAIFDADFLPNPDFLRETVQHFKDQRVGVVQTRWEHLNKNYSLLTRLQAMHLDVHFTVEQQGRYAGNLLLQFNGTAGIWRKVCIDDAGGWQADTLTEDLDLSYRAQLKGWKVVYLEKVGSPAELPVEMHGFKSQQFRWTKGGAETARKLLPLVLQTPHLTLRQKWHALVHLLSNSVFFFVLIAAVSSVPMAFLLPELRLGMGLSVMFSMAFVATTAVYYQANVLSQLDKKSSYIKALLKFLVYFPLFLALSMGLSLHNSVAAFQGYVGKKTAFVRTPKFNIVRWQDSFRHRRYFVATLKWTTFAEGFLMLYFGAAVVAGLLTAVSPFLVFHSLLAVGFGAVFFYSIRHLT